MFVFDESMYEENWTISDIVKHRCPQSWEGVFNGITGEFANIDNVLGNQAYYPKKCNIFKAFEYTSLNDVKVVLIGQDPYHNTDRFGNPRATGLSFSVADHDEIPPSLKNMYKEIKNNNPDYVIPNTGNLTNWAEQGVLLLNTSLTVYPGRPGSCKNIWMGFMYTVLNAILEKNPNTVFILLGKEAQNITSMIGRRGNLVTAAHPSPLSANNGFFGSNVFNKCNEILVANRKTPINW